MAITLLSRDQTMMLVLLATVTVMSSFLSTPASATLENKTGQLTVLWGRNKDEGSHYSFPTKQSAMDLFDYLWNAFFGGSKKGVRRPFGDAWLDGVDFFLEHGTPAEHYDVLARELAKHNIRGGPGKLLHLTATPHCKFPDDRVRKALDTGIFERIHVRFYDDMDCRIYWQELWTNWAAAYPYTKIYFGLPAAPEAGQGYVAPKEIYYSLLPFAQTASNYGGVMLWDRYYDKLNDLSSFVAQWA